MNFSIGVLESSGECVRPDILFNFFSHLLTSSKLIDIHPIKLKLTWRKKGLGEDMVAKRINRFLLALAWVSKQSLLQQWIRVRGESYHSPSY